MSERSRKQNTIAPCLRARPISNRVNIYTSHQKKSGKQHERLYIHSFVQQNRIKRDERNDNLILTGGYPPAGRSHCRFHISSFTLPKANYSTHERITFVRKFETNSPFISNIHSKEYRRRQITFPSYAYKHTHIYINVPLFDEVHCVDDTGK